MELWQWVRGVPKSTLALLAVVALFALGSLDWRPAPPPGYPKVAIELHAAGDLRAGAAKVSIDPPFPVPMGGMNARENELTTGVVQPTFARALVVDVGGKRLAIVSAELAIIPAPLRGKVKDAIADLHLDDLLIGATRTHTGVGGYLEGPAANLFGLGEFEPRTEEFLVRQLSDSIRRATAALGPARLASAAIEASKFALSLETPPGRVDSLLTGVRVWNAQDRPIANLIVFAAETGIVPAGETRLTGDWPGAMMASLETGDGPPTLFFQGAVGDTTWGKREGNIAPADRPARFGQAVAADARGALAAGGKGEGALSLDFARVDIALDSCEAMGVWAPLQRIESNWFCRSSGLARANLTTSVSYLHIGSFRLASAPGTVVAALGLAWREPLKDAAVASLVDDYIGSVATPASIESEAETPGTWDAYFGVELAPAILRGLDIARDKVIPVTGATSN